jgi:protein phosphatase 1 regulatory subunit 11
MQAASIASQTVVSVTIEEAVQGTIALAPEAADTRQRSVTFDEAIIDNEHLGKKKSKICCIFRKPYDPNASSSDETTSEEDAKTKKNEGNSYDVQPKPKKKNRHKHAEGCSH